MENFKKDKRTKQYRDWKLYLSKKQLLGNLILFKKYERI